MRYWLDDTGALWTTTTDAGNVLAERDGKWQEVTVTPLTPSDTFASTKSSDADVALMRRAAASERAAERHWPADMLAQAADTIERLRTDLAANPDADVAERIVRALEEAAEKHPNPIVRLNLSDAADIARSHATPPVAATGEGDGL